jgi:predicted ATP-grasp superfamily ATP-dependent carboligase
MEVGAFQIDEPIPNLNKPHAFAILRPWIDAGSVGSLTINLLEDTFQARPLGRLSVPGNYYDFTRYRPNIRLVDGRRTVDIPNTRIFFAHGPGSNDLLFVHLLEPHIAGEYYAESVFKVLKLLGVERYTLIGSMYDSVPHTKPLLISGYSSHHLAEELQRFNIQQSRYEGPTTITILTSQEAEKNNIDSLSLIVHLPQYAQLDEDFAGHLRLMQVLSDLYHFPLDLNIVKDRAGKQNDKINEAMKTEKQLEMLVQELEMVYEARENINAEKPQKLSPEIENFLREINKSF